MPPLNLMFKTVSSCNLGCRYCYYRQSSKNIEHPLVLPLKSLEMFVPQYMEYIADSHQASFAWQGGEPTLATLNYFRQMMNLEANSASSHTVISNGIQTNGILIDNNWAEFFREYRFLVGISLDGPEFIHNMERRDKSGHGSFKRVMAGINTLRKYDIDLNILCVIGNHNVTRTPELMDFFRREQLGYLQFIPAMAFDVTNPMQSPAYLITPEQYGNFLISFFDEWYRNGIPTISIRIFNNLLQTILGVDNDLCIQSNNCDASLVVNENGDVYPCDFYIHPSWKLGNIIDTPIKALMENPIRKVFQKRKEELSVECQDCKWVSICRGECPRNRLQGEYLSSPNYFCTSYKLLLNHAYPKLQRLAKRLSNYQLFLNQNKILVSRKLPMPNVYCPCGSGILYLLCCGDPELTISYLFQAPNS